MIFIVGDRFSGGYQGKPKKFAGVSDVAAVNILGNDLTLGFKSGTNFDTISYILPLRVNSYVIHVNL